MPTIIECHCGGFNCSVDGRGKVVAKRESGTVAFDLKVGFNGCPISLSHSSSVDDLGVRTVSDKPSTDNVSSPAVPPSL